GINKRFQRLESHVVTLARSVAHLSSEMRTHHLVMQEMDNIRAEITALRHMYKSQQYIRSGHHRHMDPYSFSNPDRVKRLTKFFGDEPPLMRLFLKKLGYEKYAALLEKEKVGAAELPYVGEDKLRALGVPLGPRMRILKEAGIHQDLHHMTRDDHNTTTTTLAIV
ncbi:jg11420, partial [Pararge aegeria aegeria]